MKQPANFTNTTTTNITLKKIYKKKFKKTNKTIE